jgi:CheY-like chemotaxis protein
VQERIAGDVLSFARIQLDMLNLYAVPMDIRKEGKKIMRVFNSEAKMKKIQLQLEFGASLDALQVSNLMTDPVRLGQVVTNLVSNAIRFTAQSDTRRITVSYNVSFLPPIEGTCDMPDSLNAPSILPAPDNMPVWLYVTVRDTGPGLSEKEQDKLFKRFSQGNKMVHTRFGGSGLGLFICRRITELLGGSIEVKSVLGEGSVFRFFIEGRTVQSLASIGDGVGIKSKTEVLDVKASIDTTPRTRSRTASLASLSIESIASSMSNKDAAELNVLVVEDNMINRNILKRQIIKAGLTCDLASNGLEALNHIHEADRQAKRGGVPSKKVYDCVIMDLEMPTMDGLTAVRAIRAGEAAGTLQRNMVIALTGNARQGQIEQAFEAGMDDGESRCVSVKILCSRPQL